MFTAVSVSTQSGAATVLSVGTDGGTGPHDAGGSGGSNEDDGGSSNWVCGSVWSMLEGEPAAEGEAEILGRLATGSVHPWLETMGRSLSESTVTQLQISWDWTDT
jgi:hypothetical protein